MLRLNWFVIEIFAILKANAKIWTKKKRTNKYVLLTEKKKKMNWKFVPRCLVCIFVIEDEWVNRDWRISR